MEKNLSSRVLIVESFVGNTKCLSSHLQGLVVPLEIMHADDAESALSLLESETVNLLIVDAGLRGKMDGFDLCRAIRSSPMLQGVPIILLLSGYLTLERSRGISAGADLLLQRPVVKEELCKMVQLLLEWKSRDATDSVPSAAEGHPARRLRPVRRLHT